MASASVPSSPTDLYANARSAAPPESIRRYPLAVATSTLRTPALHSPRHYSTQGRDGKHDDLVSLARSCACAMAAKRSRACGERIAAWSPLDREIGNAMSCAAAGARASTGRQDARAPLHRSHFNCNTAFEARSRRFLRLGIRVPVAALQAFHPACNAPAHSRD